MKINKLLYITCIWILASCGGGGGSSGGGSTATTPPPPTPSPPSPPTGAQLAEASALLNVATFGPTMAEIEQAAQQGSDAWLDDQFATPASLHMPIVDQYIASNGLDFSADPTPGLYRRYAFWERAINAPDQLRQLTAYALTQIFVVSDNVDELFIDPRGLASYYDMLLNNAFGNFRDLLGDVTLHPAMGLYLSHVNNARSNPATNTFPDENYAREVMQLFSIGLFELNPDGSLRLDNNGNPIPTYDNADIREFSKVFTGLSYAADPAGGASFFGNPVAVLFRPMEMFDAFHEPGEKRLLNGQRVPDGQSGLEDIEDAINNLFNHPNTGPFIGKQLIQRLVTSNPSAEYVSRVSAAFEGDANNPRGDMQNVIRAILTDPEASSGARLKEPFRRYVAINRSLDVQGADGTLPGAGFVGQFLTQQHVLSATSVFNFYQPNYSPSGALGDAGLVAPEFQITNSASIVGMSNLVAYVLYSPTSIDSADGFTEISVDLSPFEQLSDRPDELIDRIDLLFFASTMRAEVRTLISETLDNFPLAPLDRARVALYLALISPEYAVTGDNP